MKKYKDYQIILLTIFCILLNFGGKLLAEKLQLPLWLDSFGTILMAYAIGPFCGAIVGASGNILYGFLDPVSFAYSIIKIVETVQDKGDPKQYWIWFAVSLIGYLGSIASFVFSLVKKRINEA